MHAWLDAFVPAFGLLALGALLRRRLLRDEAVWAAVERLVFFVLLPCLLTASIASVDLGSLPLGGMAAAIWLALVSGTGASLLLARAMGQGHGAATSVLQGGVRFNNFMAFAIVGAVLGPAGTALGGVATGLIVPGVQVILTLAFALGHERGRPRPAALARQMLANPLLLGCLAGFGFAFAGGMPAGIGPLARTLGSASVALGLLAVGAALTTAGLRDRPGVQVATSLLKLVGMPALTWAFCAALDLPQLASAVAVLFMAMPTATTAYVMARVMGGDAPLMAALITTEHLLAVLTLPLWVMLLAA